MSNSEFQKSIRAFRRLHESSPLEAPVRGFNRFDRDMSPNTRELVLRARMPEIMAFSEDRRLDPAIVAGVVEASMRLGRIPDLGMYGLAGDDALAVKDFVATAMLGLEAELSQGLPQITESHAKAAQHKTYAHHYHKLAQQHQAQIDWHTKAASEANKNGRPFTAAQHEAKVAMLKRLYASHAALADYHSCEAGRYEMEAKARGEQPPADPAAAQHGAPQAHGHGAPAHHGQHGQPAHKVEQTTSAHLASFMQMPTAFLKRPAPGLKWTRKKEEEQKPRRRQESHAILPVDKMLAEAKKDEKPKKEEPIEKVLGLKPVSLDKVNKTVANAKCAPLFHALGHKLDHAEAKVKGKKKPGEEWTKKLHKICLSKGGAAAADEVIKASLTDPWIRDQGFVDEAGNLRMKWQTMMSAETKERSISDAPTSPEPVVFAINRMIDMANGRGSIY